MTKEQASTHLKRLHSMSTRHGWDGQRARLMRELRTDYVAYLKEFAAKKPESKCAASCLKEAERVEAAIKEIHAEYRAQRAAESDGEKATIGTML
jgi:hypothetical protein